MDAEFHPVTTILEQAQERGMAVGLITTTQITHATPAAFATHVSSRKSKPEIARQMLNKGVDVMLGGGENDFLPKTENGCFPKAGKRTDGRNLIREAVADGYTYLCDPSTFESFKPTASAKLLGLFADKGLTRPFAPTLAEMAQKAIDILSQDPDGFFLMIEGGQIDWASHDNDAAAAISSVIGFDRTVKVAKDFALANQDTLVIVTADHETGGMKVSSTSSSLPGEDGPFLTPDTKRFYITWSTDEHTASKVPVTAQGPMSTTLMGVQDNTSVYKAMQGALQ
jgi:alkaline phosphatase